MLILCACSGNSAKGEANSDSQADAGGDNSVTASGEVTNPDNTDEKKERESEAEPVERPDVTGLPDVIDTLKATMAASLS